MSKAVSKASSLKPEIRLAQAISQFEADLSDKQKTNFRNLKSQTLATAPTPSDVMRLTAEIDRQISGNAGSRCFGPRFTNFLQGVQQFAALADVVVGGSQNIIACSVWSLVRMSLLVSVGSLLRVRFTDGFIVCGKHLHLCRPIIEPLHGYWEICSPVQRHGSFIPSIKGPPVAAFRVFHLSSWTLPLSVGIFSKITSSKGYIISK